MTPKCDRTIKVVRFERTLLIEFAKDNLRIIQLKEVLTAYSVNGYFTFNDYSTNSNNRKERTERMSSCCQHTVVGVPLEM